MSGQFVEPSRLESSRAEPNRGRFVSASGGAERKKIICILIMLQSVQPQTKKYLSEATTLCCSRKAASEMCVCLCLRSALRRDAGQASERASEKPQDLSSALVSLEQLCAGCQCAAASAEQTERGAFHQRDRSHGGAISSSSSRQRDHIQSPREHSKLEKWTLAASRLGSIWRRLRARAILRWQHFAAAFFSGAFLAARPRKFQLFSAENPSPATRAEPTQSLRVASEPTREARVIIGREKESRQA